VPFIAHYFRAHYFRAHYFRAHYFRRGELLSSQQIPSVDAMQDLLATQGYIAERVLAMPVFLALKLEKPLFLEGEPGVGKTEVAKVMSAVLDRPLIRLQCYEGLDINTAVYEWNYARQMLQIRLMEAGRGVEESAALRELFSPDFLLKRPLLQAVDGDSDAPPVLLIDELDRADEEFEAYLLEVLSDFQITIPEIGTVRASQPPLVVITSNRTREVHDALKRRCIYHWIDYPSFEKELQIVQAKAPGAAEHLAHEVVGFVQIIRQADLYKLPGVAETIDWMKALVALDVVELDESLIAETLGVLLKYRDDLHRLQQGDAIRRVLDQTRAQGFGSANRTLPTESHPTG
jgi:MoxR-like ATPase